MATCPENQEGGVDGCQGTAGVEQRGGSRTGDVRQVPGAVRLDVLQHRVLVAPRRFVPVRLHPVLERGRRDEPPDDPGGPMREPLGMQA